MSYTLWKFRDALMPTVGCTAKNATVAVLAVPCRSSASANASDERDLRCT